MNEQVYTEREERLARQLCRLLDGQTETAVVEEIGALAAFAQALPWQSVEPSPAFRTRLRRELFGKEAQVGPFSYRFSWSKELRSLAMMAGGIAIVVIVVLALLGPRMQEIFGTVYNSITDLDGPATVGHTWPAAGLVDALASSKIWFFVVS
ncbi:MAG: hypothetical protein JXA37_10330 [Chloroflexia bacterium]|nr:hypothetical protein [Chloroflexia bacterium]